MNTEVLLKSNVANVALFGINGLEDDVLPNPSYGAIRICPATTRFIYSCIL